MKYPREVPTAITLISSNTSHSRAEMISDSIGDSSGRILLRGPSSHPVIKIKDRFARAREWVSRAHRRFGFSTSHPSLPAPRSVSSSLAMQPSSVVWLRLDVMSFDFSEWWCVAGLDCLQSLERREEEREMMRRIKCIRIV